MPVTLVPCSLQCLGNGSAMAQPTPPPTTQTFFSPSISVALPRGPTKSCTASPSLRELSCMVPAPTTWKMINGAGFAVKPGDGQGDALGVLLCARTMINWPAFAFLAMSGAWMQSSVTVGFSSRRLMIVNKVPTPLQKRSSSRSCACFSICCRFRGSCARRFQKSRHLRGWARSAPSGAAGAVLEPQLLNQRGFGFSSRAKVKVSGSWVNGLMPPVRSVYRALPRFCRRGRYSPPWRSGRACWLSSISRRRYTMASSIGCPP